MLFKILTRDKQTGVQVKKRNYNSLKSFQRFSKDIISSYSKSYDVECYQLINNEWFRLVGSQHLEEPQQMTLGADEVLALQMDLEELRSYLDSDIHRDCEYNHYTYLVGKIDAIQGVFDVE